MSPSAGEGKSTEVSIPASKTGTHNRLEISEVGADVK
jgi:hypothetical protein